MTPKQKTTERGIVMKINRTESEMKALANARTRNFVSEYGEVKTSHEEHKIFFGLFYGALLGLNWHCSTIDSEDKAQAIIDTAEYQFGQLFPEYSGYTNIYIPLKHIWATWPEEVKVGDKVCATILPATDINGNKYDETGAGGTVLEIKQNSTIIQLFDGPIIEAEGRIFDKIN